MKLKENPALLELAKEVNELLKNSYNITQQFPFSAHLTLGRIYTQNDDPLSIDSEQFPNEIEGLARMQIPVNAFVLEGHDGLKKEFELSK